MSTYVVQMEVKSRLHSIKIGIEFMKNSGLPSIIQTESKSIKAHLSALQQLENNGAIEMKKPVSEMRAEFLEIKNEIIRKISEDLFKTLVTNIDLNNHSPYMINKINNGNRILLYLSKLLEESATNYNSIAEFIETCFEGFNNQIIFLNLVEMIKKADDHERQDKQKALNQYNKAMELTGQLHNSMRRKEPYPMKTQIKKFTQTLIQ